MLISRVCDEFKCLPSEAIKELETDPEQTALDVIEVRAYQRVKDAYDHSIDERDDRLDPYRDSPLLERVMTITREIYEERRPRTGFKKQQIILTDKD